MERLRKVIAITSSCLILLTLLTWIFLDDRAFVLPAAATFLSGLYIAIWAFNRQAPDDPGGVIWREERFRRRRSGLCLECGYNLTGNITGKCSECGTEFGDDS